MKTATPEAGTKEEAMILAGILALKPKNIYRFWCHRGGGTISLENNHSQIALCPRCKTPFEPCNAVVRVA